MPNFNDLEISADGDLVVDSSGDVTASSELRTLQQEVMMRVRTNHGGLRNDPNFGANLQSVFGLRNTIGTANKIQRMVTLALANGPKLKGQKYRVLTMPIGLHTVGVIIEMVPNLPTETASAQVFSFLLNFDEGTVEDITV